MIVANVTTPAQYFHVLRRQMRQPHGKPLVLFTPKSLLRLPASFSPLDDLARGAFQAVLDDSGVLYPFAEAKLRDTLAQYPAVRDVVWVQEESKNMGAWTFVQPLLSELRPAGTALWYAGRAPSASPATGNASVHKRELAELLEDAFGAPGR